MKMKNYAVVLSMLIMLSASVFAQSSYTAPTSNVQVSLLRYTPFPAEPGNYVSLTFEINNVGGGDADNIRLMLTPDYPFSLDNNSTVRVKNSATPTVISPDGIATLGKIPALQYTTVEYNVRLAQDVLEGHKQIQVSYQQGTSNIWATETFDVFVQGTDRLEVSSVTPSILVPGKPENVVFTLKNSGTAFIRDVTFSWDEKDNKILPLGSGNRKYVESIGPHESADIPFTLVADPSATSGVYDLNGNITYTIGSNITKSLSIDIGMFIGGNGDFDVSVQDSQSGTVTLSIANIGSNPTTSVNVKIPDQPNYVAMGPSSSFIGNLNPGEFTLASFQVTPKNARDLGGNMSARPGAPATNISGFPTGTLKVDISYTDTNSNRQLVEKEVTMSALSGNATTRQFGQASSQGSSGMNLIIVGISGIVLVVVLIKYGRRIRNIFRKKAKS